VPDARFKPTHDAPQVSEGESPTGHFAGLRWLGLRSLAALLSAAVLATCTSDRSPTGPGVGGRGYLSIRPVLASPANLAAFGFTIDSVRVAVIRPATDTVVDTTVFFDPTSVTLKLSLTVPLQTSPEQFFVLLELRAGTQKLYSGVDTTQVSAGAPDTSSSVTVTLKYVGPGAGLTSIGIAPRDSVVTLMGTKQFRVSADSNGKAISSFYVSWSTSDTLTAPIDGLGVLHAPAARASVFVRAGTPDGVKDSTRVTFIPVPTAVAAFSGGGQTGAVTTRLPLPLRVQVTAADTLGVKGVPVRFQALAGGGSVRDSVVITDSLGFAEDSVSLGTLAGAATFQASVTGLTPAAFTATATAGAISAAQSVVTVSAPTLASGAAATLTLQAKDAFGNNLTSGGATVAFSASGGTSTGSIGSTADHGDGTYTATFTAVGAGTATTIGATVNGAAVTTTRPTLTVTAGAASAATSVVTVSSATVASGGSITLTLQAKDAAGNTVTIGGAAVLFSRSGGTSTGAIGATTDHADGTYSATFTGAVAGTATTIGATVNGAAVTTALPTVTVTAGAISAVTSLVTASTATVTSGASLTITLQSKDAAGNNLTTGGATVVFSHSGGTSGGTIAPSPATDNGNGTYSATFIGTIAGTPSTIGATINGTAVTTTLPTVTVTPGTISVTTSGVSVSSGTVASGGAVTLTLLARDAAGNTMTTGGATVVFTASGGTSSGTITPGTALDNGNGTYTATFTGGLAGTPLTIGATVNGTAVTTSLPTVTVTAGAISAATSLVAASSPIVAAGAIVTLTLQAKDSAGNNLTTGGAAVAFTATGGTSTGTIAPTPATDNGDGTYAAVFTGVVAGTATTIRATVNGILAISTVPITVVAGNSTTGQSLVSVSTNTVASGGTVTLTLRARDSLGNNLTTGGLTVVFSPSGGTSSGTIAPTPATDNGNGSYTATFTAVLAGTATTIGATMNGVAVTSTLPTITVTPGVISTATSIVQASAASVASGGSVILSLQARDAAGNNLLTGGAAVAFTAAGGTSTGSIGVPIDLGNGTYTATFTGVLAGTATAIGATINGAPVTTALPTVTVTAGAPSAATSVITVSSNTIVSGASGTLTLQAKDAAGNALTSGGATVLFSASGGTSTGSIVPSPATDNGNGAYTATFTGVLAGSTLTIGATINGSPVTSTLPTVTVVPGATARVTVVPSTVTLTALGVTQPFSAEARDLNDNVVAGEAFTWFSSSAAVATIDGNGLATAVTNGSTTITATAGNAVSGTAALTVAQVATQLAFTVQPSDAVAGTTISPPVEVQVRDAGGSLATNFTDNVTLIRSDLIDCFATLVGTTTVPAVSGVARFTDLSFEQACPGMELRASSGVLPPVQSAPFTITAAPAAVLSLVSGDQQSAPVGSVLPEPLTVRVTDAFGNPLAGEPVDWLVSSGGGSLAPGSSVTDAAGFAAAAWTLGAAPGTNLAQAISGKLDGSPAVITAVGFPVGTTSLWVGSDATSPSGWSVGANWRDGRVPTASDNAFIPASAAHQPVLSQSAVVGDLIGEAGASVIINAGVVLTAGGSVNGGVTIGGAGSLDLTGTGVTVQGAVPNVVVSGQVAAAGPVNVAGDLLVSGSLDLGGQPVTVSGDFATSGQGILTMTQPGEALLVHGNVGFNGGPTLGSLTDGIILVAGNFVVTDSNSATPFAATGFHQVVFNGATLQQISGVRATRVSQSHFQNLTVASSDTVRPSTALRANGAVTVSSGIFDAGGQSVSVGGDLVTLGVGILRMTTAADLVAVQGNAIFKGGNESAQMFDGVLRVAGDFTEAGSPSTGGSFEAAGTHLVEMNGSAPQTISFGDPFLSHFGNLVIANTSTEGVTFLTDASAVDSLTVQAGSSVSLGASVFRLNDVTNHGTIDVANGTLEVNQAFTHSAGAVLQGSGTVDVTNATVTAFNGIVRPGKSPGLLTINGAAALGTTAAIDIDLAGSATPGTDYDQLRVTNGSLTLAGSLNVGLLGAFTPLAGDTFQVLTFASRAANLGAVTGLDLGNGVVLDTVWSATGLALVARQVIPLNGAPIDLASSAPAGRVYALGVPGGAKNGTTTSVVTIDAKVNQPIDTILLDGAAFAYALSVNTTNEKLYVSDVQGGLFVVDASSGTVGTIAIPQPGFTTVNEAKNLVYLPAGVQVGLNPGCTTSACPIYAPALFKIDGTADTVFSADTVFVGSQNQRAFGAAFNPNNGEVYVAVYDAAVVRIVNPDLRAVIGSIDVGLPYAVAVNPATNKLYVSSDVDSSVSVFDLSTPTPNLLKNIRIGGYIPNITVDVASSRIYVANYDSSTVTVIDGATDEVIKVLRAGATTDGAYDAVVNPVDGLLYVARFNAGEITIMRP
jgi:YVTN family beta-propeller protein